MHLEQLEREGLLNVAKDGKISLTPTFQPAQQIGLRSDPPSVRSHGSFLAGGSIKLDLRGIGLEMPPDLYGLRVFDNTMADAGLKPGDVAIMSDFSPRPGDIVAVEIRGQMTLRRFLILAEIPHLLAENSVGPDLRLAIDIPMHGVLWASIRPEQRRNGPSTTPYPKEDKGSSRTDWPEPPSGIHLNDLPTTAYLSTAWLRAPTS